MGKKTVCGALGSLSLPDHKSFFIPKWHESFTEPRSFFPTPFLACTTLGSPPQSDTQAYKHIPWFLLAALLFPKAVYVLGLER